MAICALSTASPFFSQHPPIPNPRNTSESTTATGPPGSNAVPDGGGPKHRLTAVRSRLSQLCKDGRPDLARRLFDTLPRPAPTLLWNTLLIGFVCNSMPEEALRLYARMSSSNASSDPYTYSSALKACADTGQLRLGKSVHCHVIRRLGRRPKNRVLNNSLLNMYSGLLSADDAGGRIVRSVFEGMTRRRNSNVVAWNTMIAWHVKARRAPLDALRQFVLMMEAGVSPTAVTFINVFPAAAASLRTCRPLHGLLLKFDRAAADPFVLSRVIFAYSELSDVPSGRRVFDCAPEEKKNTQVWNTMMWGYVQNDLPHEALALFITAISSLGLGLGSEIVLLADTVTFLAALMAVSQLQVLELGQQIHGYLLKTNPLPTILVNALLVMYSRCNSVTTAFELFHQQMAAERDVVSWNTMISALVQNGFNLEGLMLVYEMQKEEEEGFRPDSVTATALLSAASNLGDIRVGKETHAYIIRNGIQSQGMTSYLIDMYAKSAGGSVETARLLFDGIKPCERDQVTWNAMIAGYTQRGQAECAFSVFRQMLQEENPLLTPNSVTLSSILPACNLAGGIRAGKQIHGFAVRNFLDRNVFVGTALVDMYSKCGGIVYAESVFDAMPERNSVTYTTMVSGFGQHGMGETALSLFRMMERSGVKPDAVTLVAVLSACSYSGLVDEGLEIFDSMETEFGIPRSPEHCSCVVDMLGRAGRVEAAYEFVRELGDKGNFVGIWGSLLAACKMHQKYELGELVAERLFEIGKENASLAGYHVLLSNVYASEGKWEYVDSIRKGMRHKGMMKELGSSWIEVADTAARRFTSRDQSHPEHDQIHGMLKELAMEMKLAGYDEPIAPGLVDDGMLESEE